MDEDDVGGVVGNNDIVVPPPRAGREAACAVRAELAAMHCFYVEVMDAIVWWQGLTAVARRCCL